MAKSAAVSPKRRLTYPRLSHWRTTLYYFSFFALIAFYVCLVFVPLPDPATLHHYHLTAARYRILILPILIFLVLIWLASFYGSLKMKSYASLIRKSPDGEAMNIIGNGFIVLALSAPFTASLTSLVNLISRHVSGTRPTLTIINNYIDLVLMAAAMLLIAHGAEMLSRIAGRKLSTWPEKIWVSAFIIFSSLYGYFLVGQTTDILNRRTYFMPHWLVLITIVIPYLFVWYAGLKGSEEIYQYQKNVRGTFYKSALKYLAAGISLVIASSVITRSLTTISDHLNHLHLTPILFIIYGLLIIMGAGYVLIAVGAKRLRQIEEA